VVFSCSKCKAASASPPSPSTAAAKSVAPWQVELGPVQLEAIGSVGAAVDNCASKTRAKKSVAAASFAIDMVELAPLCQDFGRAIAGGKWHN